MVHKRYRTSVRRNVFQIKVEKYNRPRGSGNKDPETVENDESVHSVLPVDDTNSTHEVDYCR
jgi:hypothetical protein